MGVEGGVDETELVARLRCERVIAPPAPAIAVDDHPTLKQVRDGLRGVLHPHAGLANASRPIARSIFFTTTHPAAAEESASKHIGPPQ
jgi:hypothetical protein